MASEQQKQMNELYASIKERLSNPDIDLATRRDNAENFHLAAREPGLSIGHLAGLLLLHRLRKPPPPAPTRAVHDPRTSAVARY